MEIFSETLARLYEAAEHTTPDQFPARVLRLLMPLIRFDGAILNAREFNATYCGELPGPQAQEPGLAAPRTAAPQKAEFDLVEHAPGLHDDLIAGAFLSSLSQPLRYDCETLFAKGMLPHFSGFARKHGLYQMMLYGDLPDPTKSPQWFALYRRAGHDFSEIDAVHLKVIWSHVTQAISMNLKLALNNVDPTRNKRALALINSKGILESVDQGMLDLLELEWPGFEGSRLPLNVMQELLAANFYRGKRIELSTFSKFGYLACMASATSIISTLAPSEVRVAHRFAKGMTHSEIAAHLGVSPHTVRNQLAQVYHKLGIHGKAELARLLVYP